MRPASAAAFVAALVLCVPASASAAIRYASPTGVDTGACGSGAACNLKRAIEQAQSNDEVIVTAGTYSVTTPISSGLSVALNVHGQAPGAAAPLISFSGSGQLSINGAIRNLRAQGSGLAGSTLERVQVFTGNGATACAAVRVLESLCSSAGGRAVDVGAGTDPLVRNVTAIGGQYGVFVQTDSTGAVDAQVVNTIARGVNADLYAFGNGVQATIRVRYSNFGDSESEGSTSLIDRGAGNQSGEPALTATLRETSFSPTRDAGEPAPGTDFEGQQRPLGAGTDIGGDEFAPGPFATTLPAIDVRGTSATLRGTVDPQGEASSYVFEYSASPLLGSVTPATSLPAGVGSRAVAAKLTGLQPETTYFYRLAASNPSGSRAGTTLSFTTPLDDSEAPLIGELGLTRRRFAVGRAFTPVSAAQRGTTLSFRVSERGRSDIAVQRPKPGRRRSGRCVAPRRARPGARRCTRWSVVITLDRAVSAGRNAVPFSGRIGSRRLSRSLRPGRYRFRITAADRAGNRSRPGTIGFRIVRP